MTDDKFETAYERVARKAIVQERERCALLAETLCLVWERTAAKMRAQSAVTTRSIWPPFRKYTFVAPAHEKAARDIEAVVKGIREAVVEAIRKGWAPLDIDQRESMRYETNSMTQQHVSEDLKRRVAQITAEIKG